MLQLLPIQIAALFLFLFLVLNLVYDFPLIANDFPLNDNDNIKWMKQHRIINVLSTNPITQINRARRFAKWYFDSVIMSVFFCCFFKRAVCPEPHRSSSSGRFQFENYREKYANLAHVALKFWNKKNRLVNYVYNLIDVWLKRKRKFMFCDTHGIKQVLKCTLIEIRLVLIKVYCPIFSNKIRLFKKLRKLFFLNLVKYCRYIQWPFINGP